MYFLYHYRRCAVVHRFPLTSGSHVHHGPWRPTEGPFHQFCPRDFGPPHRATVFRALEKQISSAWETASLLVRTMKRIHYNATFMTNIWNFFEVVFFCFLKEKWKNTVIPDTHLPVIFMDNKFIFLAQLCMLVNMNMDFLPPILWWMKPQSQLL